LKMQLSSMEQFQLSHLNLQDWAGPHDMLLLDEAQDMNLCMLDVCLQQNVPKIVVVGEQHQQIYSFMGAVNALDLVMESSLTTVRASRILTQSFRFGSDIAFLANSCLRGVRWT
jgi:F-box protein 18 (helicase)